VMGSSMRGPLFSVNYIEIRESSKACEAKNKVNLLLILFSTVLSV
jgi:hypothetical protein